jgi:hypothetical protein
VNLIEIGLTVREERRLSMVENAVLRRVFVPKKDEVTGDWKRLHNEELYDLHTSPNIIRVIVTEVRCIGHVARMGDRRGACRVLVGRPEGKRPWGRFRHRWEWNITPLKTKRIYFI